MRTRTLLILLVLFVGTSSVADAGWWDALDRGRTVDLGDVIAQPHRYKTGLITFFGVYNKRRDVFNPLATPFNRARYANVALWADSAPVWEEDTFRHEFPFVYMALKKPELNEFLGLEPFTRIEVTGRIRAVVRGMPMIEVESFRRTSHRLGRAVVQSVQAGDRFAEMADYELAYENYRRALQPDLPPAYEMLLKKRVAASLVRIGRVEEARALAGSDEILADSHLPKEKRGDGVPVTPGPEGDGGYLSGPSGPAAPTTPAVPRPAPRELPVAPYTPLPITPSPLTNDLPGQPSGPVSSDLPGELVQPEAGTPPPPTTDAPPPRRSAADRIPGAPRRHNPRLSGVK